MPGPSARRRRRSPAALGADVHVRAEGAVDGGLDARMAQLQAQCPTWVAGPDRAPNLVVVMYSSAEREASVFYGAGQADALELRWEHAVDTMGPSFAAGDYTGGVLTGLDALRRRPAGDVHADVQPDALRRRGHGDVVVWCAAGHLDRLVVLVVVAAVRVAQFVSTGQWEDDDGDDDGDATARSVDVVGSRRSWRRRSAAARRRRQSSGSSSRRRSSGRAGGGTKSW